VYGNPRSGYHQYFPNYLSGGGPPESGGSGAAVPERSAQFNSYLPYFHAQKQQQQQHQELQEQQHCQVTQKRKPKNYNWQKMYICSIGDILEKVVMVFENVV
jgi:hypothetical protein